MGLLDDSVAVLTGAGRGIGGGEALELPRNAARVVVGPENMMARLRFSMTDRASR